MDLHVETGKLGAKLVDTLIEHNYGLHSENCNFPHDPSAYHILVGKLIYLTITHLGQGFDVNDGNATKNIICC